MAKTKARAKTVSAADTVRLGLSNSAPSVGATVVGGAEQSGEPRTPQEIAAVFKGAVAEVEKEQSVTLHPTGARVGGPVSTAAGTPVVAPAPQWTAAGIGRVGVHLTNMALGASDFELLEDEEEKGLAEDVAYYLSVRWPSGSKWEPEARILARVTEVWGPRLGARYKAQREEAARLEREAADLEATRGEQKRGPGKVSTAPTAGPPSVVRQQATLPSGHTVEVPPSE